MKKTQQLGQNWASISDSNHYLQILQFCTLWNSDSNPVVRHSNHLHQADLIGVGIQITLLVIRIVIAVSRHDLDDHKHKDGVATDLFCTDVIGHPSYVFLNQGPKSLIKNDITGLQNDLEILSSGVQLRVRKDYHPHDARSRTVPIRHILSSKSIEHAFIYRILIR